MFILRPVLRGKLKGLLVFQLQVQFSRQLRDVPSLCLLPLCTCINSDCTYTLLWGISYNKLSYYCIRRTSKLFLYLVQGSEEGMDSKYTREGVTAKQPHLKRSWGSIPGSWNCSCQASSGCVLLLLLVWLYNIRTYTYFFNFSIPASYRNPCHSSLLSPMTTFHKRGELSTYSDFKQIHFLLGNYKAPCDPQKWFNSGVHQATVVSRNVLLPVCLKISVWNLCTKDLK